MAFSIDTIEPDKVDKIIGLLLGLPGRILDSLFRLYEGIDHPVEPRIKYLCLLALASGGLIICYKYRKNFLSWFMGLYLLLILVSGGVTVFVPVIEYLFPPTIKVRGTIGIYTLVKARPSDVISGDWRSNDCGIDQTREIQRCGSQGQPLSPPFDLHVTSANCGSNVENIKRDDTNPNCLLVRERLQGCGNQRILGITNCKGRGWLSYFVDTAGQAEELKLAKSVDVDFSAPFQSEVKIDLPEVSIPASQFRVIKYHVDARVGSAPSVTLTEENPMAAGMQSDTTASKLVIYRSGRSSEAANSNDDRSAAKK